MTTINTMEDLLRLLDENPEWLEALRSRLLTREVLEMPQTLARFIEATNQRLDALEQQVGVVESDVTVIKTDVQEMKGDLKTLQTEGKSMRADIQSLKTTTERLDRNIQAIRNDMGYLKAGHARNAAVEDAYNIVLDMGLRYVETLSREQLRRMSDESDTSDLSTGDLRSFHHADLVIRAVEAEGRPCYIAVEISFTANGRDTDRAIRNAGLLTRFTGAPAYPAIAGVRLDNRVQQVVDSGQVYFYELEEEQLEVE